MNRDGDEIEMDIQGGEPRALIRWVAGAQGKKPEQGYTGDAGFDLYVAKAYDIEPGETVDVTHDIRVQLPDGMWAMIVGRSSTTRTRGLLVNMAIIDNGYRGEIFTSVSNFGLEGKRVRTGERISQLICLPIASVKFVQTSVLGKSSRGEKGFGSSGT